MIIAIFPEQFQLLLRQLRAAGRLEDRPLRPVAPQDVHDHVLGQEELVLGELAYCVVEPQALHLGPVVEALDQLVVAPFDQSSYPAHVRPPTPPSCPAG